jgi:hypothetical protein
LEQLSFFAVSPIRIAARFGALNPNPAGSDDRKANQW